MHHNRQSLLHDTRILATLDGLHARADDHDARVIPAVFEQAVERGASSDQEMADLLAAPDGRTDWVRNPRREPRVGLLLRRRPWGAETVNRMAKGFCRFAHPSLSSGHDSAVSIVRRPH